MSQGEPSRAAASRTVGSGANIAATYGIAVIELTGTDSGAVIAASEASTVAVGQALGADLLDTLALVPLDGTLASGNPVALALTEHTGRAEAPAAVALVIDDEMANREYYAAAFDQIGWRAETAATGNAGVMMLTAAEPAVALVDVRLPDMNGYDVCRQLRSVDRRQCFVVLMSSDPTMVEPQRAASAGADLALVGPIGVGQLRTITERRPPSQVRVRPGSEDRVASSGVRLKLFGEPELNIGEHWWPLPAGAATDIISVMAIHHPSVLSTSDLGELAWSPPATSASPVHTALSRLRTALANNDCPELVVTSQQGYRLDVQACNVDTLAFEKAADALDAGALGDQEYLQRAREILTGIGDTAFGASSVPAVEAARVRIWESRAVLEERVSVRQILLADTVEAVATARRLTARELWRESAWTILVAALYHSGRQREALETYQVARNLLVNSVGVDPSPALRDIEARVLNQDPVLQQPEFIRALAR